MRRPRQAPRPGHRRAGRRLVVAGATLTLTLSAIASACGDDDSSGASSTDPTSTTKPETTPTTLSPEEEVEAAYLAFWDMATRLAEDPDPDDPEIPQRASGQALGNLVDGLTTLRAANQRTELRDNYEHNVLSVEIDGDSARLEDCAVDDAQIVDAETGNPVRESTVTELVEVTLVRSQQRWLVDSSSRIHAWNGPVECH